MSAFQVLRAFRGPSARFVAAPNTSRQAAAYASRPHCASAVRSYSSKGKEKEEEKSSSSTEEQNGQQQGGKTSSQSPENDIAVKLQAKQDEVVELTNRLRYAQADFMNLQRISAREKEQTKDFAISRFAADLLETADALALALRAADVRKRSESNPQSSPGTPPAYFDPSSPRPDALIQGVEATQRILLQTLAKYGIKPFDPTGDLFDPNHHEALYSAPVPGKKSGEILDCQKTGYMIKDRVLRAAQVGVAAEPPVPSSQKSDSEGPQS